MKTNTEHWSILADTEQVQLSYIDRNYELSRRLEELIYYRSNCNYDFMKRFKSFHHRQVFIKELNSSC